MSDSRFEEYRELVARYDFRDVHPNVRFGTASDRYAAWIGQIYEERWRDHIQRRTHRLARGSFEERTLPVPSVAEYFEHFSVLEIDFTYYRPLLDVNGHEEPGVNVLRQYGAHAPPDAHFLLKVPQQFFSRLRRRSVEGNVTYDHNPTYLDARACTEQFLAPALTLLGERLAGFIFEQEYGRAADPPDEETFIAELDAFFGKLPPDVQHHVELRSPHRMTPAYFDWLEDSGIGFVFSHWTWLPPLREQWQKLGGRFTAADGSAVCRLMTPLRVRHEDAYVDSHPFEAPIPAYAESDEARRLVLDATALAFQAETHDVLLHLITNNSAYGNAPALSQRIANRILDEDEKRSG